MRRREFFFCMSLVVSLAMAVPLATSTSSRAEAGAKRVLMLQSFGFRFKPWTDYAEKFRAELTRQSKVPIDFHDQTLSAARLIDERLDAPFVDYLHSLYEEKGPDLIVALGAPAANFVQRYRARIFPKAPMLYYAVEARRVQYDQLTENDTVAAVAHDFPLAIETILQVLPRTKVIMVVNGASPNETYWQEVLERELAPLSGRVELRWSNRLSFEELLKGTASLPPDSAIFWHLMSVDAKGVPHEATSALSRLSAAANAPIFSYLDVFFGASIVGGAMHSLDEGSAVAAAVAIRILNGDKAGDVKTPPTRFTAPRFDWRQLQRWGISERSLPKGSEVLFREPSAWQKYQLELSAIAATMLLLIALIGWLIYEHRRRSLAEVQSRKAMAELASMNRLATAGQLSASIAHEINQPLTGMMLKANAALRWLAVEKPDIERVRNILTDIVAAGQRAGDIVNGVRAMFKKGESAKAAINLNSLISTVLALLRVDLQKDGVRVETKLDETLPAVTGDPVQLQQVILNLIVNAADAMRNVHPRVLQVQTSRSPSGMIRVSIEDSGPGIVASDRERIFDPLFTTKDAGMGMGLSICRSIIESHGGSIWVSAAAERGAVFQLELPEAQIAKARPQLVA